METVNAQARTLFRSIAGAYDAPAEVLSFAQYGRWRRFAVDALDVAPGARVLDVATGTGLVARDLIRRRRARVVGVDLTPEMLAGARRRGVTVGAARAETLPFRDAAFDGLSVSYLLRYVDDPEGTVRELVRVLRPGAPFVSIEFGLPDGALTQPLWRLYATRVFPVLASAVSPGWREVGSFLPRSIESYRGARDLAWVESLWRGAGAARVQSARLSFGAGVVTWGRKAA